MANAKTQTQTRAASSAEPTRASPSTARTALPQMTVEESKTVPDGAHLGVIADVIFSERGEEGFPYVDVHITETESDVTLKAGYAASRVTPETELGRLLRRMGAEVRKGENVNWGVLAQGTNVAFTTETERKKNGKFARIILESIRPAENAE